MSVITEGSAEITAEDEWAEISYVPQGARVAISLSGISDSTVTLEASWLQSGTYEIQKTYTEVPAEAEHFDAPRACSLRLGVATSNYGSDTINARIGFDYPVKTR